MAGHIKGTRVLDLFAGSGSLGIEAISRGASSVMFVDKFKYAVEIIKENLNILMPEDLRKTEVLSKDIKEAIKFLYDRKDKFDIIFLDPPYYKDWLRKCLKYLNIYDILSHSGFVIAEHFKKDYAPAKEDTLGLTRQLTYGNTVISIYKRLKDD
jgi:16S rRNA (guanine(966)-N(2))-methyltransferase RsmD